MTLTIAPETETRLRTVAAGHGLAPEQALEVLRGRALTDAEADRQETMAGLRQSAQEFAEGRWLPPDELDAELRVRPSQIFFGDAGDPHLAELQAELELLVVVNGERNVKGIAGFAVNVV